MKDTTPSAAQVWKQLEDDLVPRLRLSTTDRAVYSHLLRHTFLEGKATLHFSIAWLSHGTRLSGAVRASVRRLVDKGALRLLERTRAGHLVEVRLPHQVPSSRLPAASPRASTPLPAGLEDMDFLKSRSLPQFIHVRERGQCFYCLRRLSPRTRCIDHVVPRVHRGRNSYRNLVSACVECNSQKGERSGEDFLRFLYRRRRLTDAEFNARLRALHALAAGKLRPVLPSSANPRPRQGRPPLNPTGAAVHNLRLRRGT